MRRACTCSVLMLSLIAGSATVASPPVSRLGMAEVLRTSADTDWRRPDPDSLVLLELDRGAVLFELAPDFAPAAVANIRTLIRQGYFDGLRVLRAQDNYVVQWGDPAADDPGKRRSLGEAAARVAAEFERSIEGAPPFTRLPDSDTYADEVGFVAGFAVARSPRSRRMWMAHCYGALGVARDDAADSGNGSGLYVVIGHAPRHLDRNISLVGRVLRGMELLSSMPRGSAALGFYQDDERGADIRRMRVVADLPESERPAIEVLRTDTERFAMLVEARRNRHESWFHEPTGRVELCNVPVPVRDVRRE